MKAKKIARSEDENFIILIFLYNSKFFFRKHDVKSGNLMDESKAKYFIILTFSQNSKKKFNLISKAGNIMNES